MRTLPRRTGLAPSTPRVFHRGGDPAARQGGGGKSKGKGRTAEEQRVAAVMGLVQLHQFEHRAWDPRWGPKTMPAVGGRSIVEGWVRHDGPMSNDPFFGHKQLRWSVGSSSASWGTILRPGGQPLAAYESRDVFIVSLPELLLTPHGRTAAEVYDEWQEAEVIIGSRRRHT